AGGSDRRPGGVAAEAWSRRQGCVRTGAGPWGLPGSAGQRSLLRAAGILLRAVGSGVTGLAVIGSTGSSGRQTLDVVRSLPDRFRVIGLAAGNNVTVLEEQLREFRPRLVSVQREQDYLRERIRQDGLRCEWATAEEIASHPD